MIEYRKGQEQGTLTTEQVRLRATVPAIILWDPKFPHNVGSAVRTASCYGVSQIWQFGRRVSITAHSKDERLPREERMPGYADVTLFNTDHPFDCFPPGTIFVAVEVRPGKSESLFYFEHPTKAVYVFGPEDGSLPPFVLKHCHRFVRIETTHCLNLNVAIATVLYDRACKDNVFQR